MPMGIIDARRGRYWCCMKPETLASNIRALRTHLDLSQAELADAVDSDQPNVSKWERGVAPSAVTLSKLAQLAEVSVQDFMDLPWHAPAQPRTPDIPPVVSVGSGEMVDIVKLDLRFSMGPGTNIDDYIEEAKLSFDLSYIRSFTRTQPSRLRIAQGVGDSMFPTLQSSDLVWIDTTQTALNQQDRIWAISLYGAAGIKRLRAAAKGKVLVISDNPDVPDQEVDAEDIVIGGRVIRYARDV